MVHRTHWLLHLILPSWFLQSATETDISSSQQDETSYHSGGTKQQPNGIMYNKYQTVTGLCIWWSIQSLRLCSLWWNQGPRKGYAALEMTDLETQSWSTPSWTNQELRRLTFERTCYERWINLQWSFKAIKNANKKASSTVANNSYFTPLTHDETSKFDSNARRHHTKKFHKGRGFYGCTVKWERPSEYPSKRIIHKRFEPCSSISTIGFCHSSNLNEPTAPLRRPWRQSRWVSSGRQLWLSIG